MTKRCNPHDFEGDLNQAQLIRLLSYDPATGDFRWLDSGKGWVKVGAIAGKVLKRGYRIITIDQVGYYAHRLAWLYMTGTWPEALVDHEDRNPSNNAWSNLRPATRSQNNSNRAETPGVSGVTGVYWHEQRQKWTARISHNNKLVYLGLFETVEEAKAARLQFEIEQRGDFARKG